MTNEAKYVKMSGDNRNVEQLSDGESFNVSAVYLKVENGKVMDSYAEGDLLSENDDGELILKKGYCDGLTPEEVEQRFFTFPVIDADGDEFDETVDYFTSSTISEEQFLEQAKLYKFQDVKRKGAKLRETRRASKLSHQDKLSEKEKLLREGENYRFTKDNGLQAYDDLNEEDKQKRHDILAMRRFDAYKNSLDK